MTKIPADENQLQHRENTAPSPVPPKVLTGLTLAASGSSWDDAAAAVGLKAATLRRWHRTDPRCQEFIETVVRENINTANNVLTNALPRLADELVTMAMDRSVKPYSRIAAISEAFKILQTGVVDQQQREQIEAIKAQLTALEDGTPNVIDV